MPKEIRPGAMVEATDYPVGPVEKVERDKRTGEPSAIIVRHGRADYLLRIPCANVSEASAGRVYLDLRLDELETYALEHSLAPPAAQGIRDAGPTRKGLYEEQVLGRIAGAPPHGPPTG